jgi:hypothetical protein
MNSFASSGPEEDVNSISKLVAVAVAISISRSKAGILIKG